MPVPVLQTCFLLQGAGAGELLTAVVGMALTGLGFAIYKQRRSISIPAVAVTAVAAAAFNVMSTVGATHLVPLTAGELPTLCQLLQGCCSLSEHAGAAAQEGQGMVLQCHIDTVSMSSIHTS
jgi:hypothetical protein